MNTLDSDLNAWRRQWQDLPSTKDSQDLSRRAAREWRRTLWGLVAPVLVSVCIGGGLIVRAMNSGALADIGLAVGAWCFIVIAWVGCLWLGRDTWRPRNESTVAFIDLAIARCEGWIRATPLALLLYVAEMLFVTIWTLRNSERTLAELLWSGPAIALGWLGLPGLIAVAVWWRRNQVTQRGRLLTLRQQLADG